MKQAIIKQSKLPDEWELIQMAQKDRRMFRPLYERYYEQIFAYILTKTNDQADSADICSAVFLKAMSQLGSYKNLGFPFSSWLYKIAINACNDHFKNRAKKRYVLIDSKIEGELSALFEESEHPYQAFEKKLANALSQLKGKELAIIEARYFEKKSFNEIAFLFDITENNAKVRTYRVLDKLKKIIRPKA